MMNPSNGATVSVDWIVKALTSGRFAERVVAQRHLNDERKTLDRQAARDKLIHLIRTDFSPQREADGEAAHVADVRCWLLGSLGRLPFEKEEPVKTLRNHVDFKVERNKWARYWALTSLLRLKPPDLKEICAKVVKDDKELLPKMLAAAVLAQGGDDGQRRLLIETLEETLDLDEERERLDELFERQWAVLRALRFVYLAPAFESIRAVVEAPQFNDVTYDAIAALGNTPPESSNAENAGLTLVKFITLHRRYSIWDSMRIRAIESLGLLKSESTAYLLMEEIADFNPAVAAAAASAMESTLGPQTAVTRVLELLVKRGDQDLSRYARGLREMRDQKAIVEELGTVMLSHGGATQDFAQRLLSEIGGLERELQKRISAIYGLGASDRGAEHSQQKGLAMDTRRRHRGARDTGYDWPSDGRRP